MEVRELFENELRRRGIGFSTEATAGRYELHLAGMELLVSIENLERGWKSDRDPDRVSRFVEAVLKSQIDTDEGASPDRIYWNMEPSDCDAEVPAPIRRSLSTRIDQTLVLVSADNGLVSWVTRQTLERLALTEAEAAQRADANLARELRACEIVIQHIDGVALVMLEADLPFKAPLLLAPNLREVVGSQVEWPLLAVAPDRDFVYLWSAEHRDLIGRVGDVVVREYARAPYPLSTEVFEIGDNGMKAIGAFPIPSSGGTEGDHEGNVS